MNNARTPATCNCFLYIVFAILLALKSSYLGWNYSDPETAVLEVVSVSSTKSNTKRFPLRLFWQSDKSRSIEKGGSTFCCHPLCKHAIGRNCYRNRDRYFKSHFRQHFSLSPLDCPTAKTGKLFTRYNKSLG